MNINYATCMFIIASKMYLFDITYESREVLSSYVVVFKIFLQFVCVCVCVCVCRSTQTEGLIIGLCRSVRWLKRG